MRRANDRGDEAEVPNIVARTRKDICYATEKPAYGGQEGEQGATWGGGRLAKQFELEPLSRSRRPGDKFLLIDTADAHSARVARRR